MGMLLAVCVALVFQTWYILPRLSQLGLVVSLYGTKALLWEGREPLSCIFWLISLLLLGPHIGHCPLNLRNLLPDGTKHPLYSLASKIHIIWDSVDCSGRLSEDQPKIRAGGTSKWAQLPPTRLPSSTLFSSLFLKYKQASGRTVQIYTYFNYNCLVIEY